jgi:hypothetical protein
MLRDVQYFKSRISRLDGAAHLVDYLIKIVAEKRVQVQQQPGPPVDQSETVSPSTPSPQSGDDAIVGEKP